MATAEEKRRRVAAMYAAAGIAQPVEVAGPRMSITFGGGAADPRVQDIRNRMDPDYEGQFDQTAAAAPKPTTITVEGQQARDYSKTPNLQQNVKNRAATAWRQTPVPVLDARDLNDEKIISENDRASRYGLSVSPLDARIAATARARRDPRAVQKALERLGTEDVVTGGPGLDPGETMPSGTYSRMRREETARAVADKTGKVQYLSPAPGNIAEWISPSNPASVETIGASPGQGGQPIWMLPADQQRYKAATDKVFGIKNALHNALYRVANGDPQSEMLKTSVIPYLQQRENETIADLRKIAGEIKAKGIGPNFRPTPASNMSPGFGIPQQDMLEVVAGAVTSGRISPQQLEAVKATSPQAAQKLQGWLSGNQGGLSGPQTFQPWLEQAKMVEDLTRRGLRTKATELARELMGKATIQDWMPDRWYAKLGPQLQGYMAEAMRSNPRVDSLGLFNNVVQKLRATVTGELPSRIKQQRDAERRARLDEVVKKKAERDALNQDYRRISRRLDALTRKNKILTPADEGYKEYGSEAKKLEDRLEEIDKKLLGEKATTDLNMNSGFGASEYPPAPVAQPAPENPKGVHTIVRTQADFDALPSGAIYITDDGKTARKP